MLTTVQQAYLPTSLRANVRVYEIHQCLLSKFYTLRKHHIFASMKNFIQVCFKNMFSSHMHGSPERVPAE